MTSHTNIITNELNRMFLDFNAMLFENKLPAVEIIIQRKGKHNAYGWFTTGKVWSTDKHEITITAEHLDRGILKIACTLIHEMIHLYNASNGIEDCSRGGTYHNNNFKIKAESVGLIVKKDSKYGYSHTELSDMLSDKIINLKYIDVFNVKRIEEIDGNTNKPKKPSNIKKYTCPVCGQIARGSKEIFIICGHCNETMLETV